MSMTVSITGSAKFHELQAFPLDPDDYFVLQQHARREGINIYLRLISDGECQTIIMIDHPQHLARLWRAFEHETDQLTAEIEMALIGRVYDTFVTRQSANLEDVENAKMAVKILCLHYLPILRDLSEAPRENIIGMILEFQQNVYREYCYCNFDLDDIPTMRATRH